MKYLHTMIRVSDPDATIRFFDLLGLREIRRMDSEQGRFTLIFLAAPGDEVAHDGMVFHVDAVEGQRIDRLTVTFQPLDRREQQATELDEQS